MLALTLAAPSSGRAAPAGTPDDEQDLFSITVDAKGYQPYRIAVTEPLGNDQPLGKFVREIMVNNLRIATAFRVLEERIYPGAWRGHGLTPEIPKWRAIGSQGLIMSEVQVTGEQAIYTFKLWDFDRGLDPELERTFNATRKGARSVVHQWCNAVMQHYTKVPGAFGTRIAFSATHSPTIKAVYTMDHDGHDLRQVSQKKSLNILPSWSPDGRHIIFTSYVRRNPDLYQVSALGGILPKRVSRRIGLNSGAVYSPDGSKVALTLTKDGDSEIYILDPNRFGRYGWEAARRVTNHPGIDTSPTWSPDGTQIAFVSNRFGNPHLWITNADGTGTRRLTRRGFYNQTPAWCPMKDSKLIAFTSRKGRRMSIFTYHTGMGTYRRITHERQGNNEEPSWAPNCQLIAFASSRGGIWVSNSTGTAQTQIYTGDALQPRWGPWATQR